MYEDLHVSIKNRCEVVLVFYFQFFLKATQLEQMLLDYTRANEQREITKEVIEKKQQVKFCTYGHNTTKCCIGIHILCPPMSDDLRNDFVIGHSISLSVFVPFFYLSSICNCNLDLFSPASQGRDGKLFFEFRALGSLFPRLS